MHIGDKLLLCLVSKKGNDLTRIIHNCCEFLDPYMDKRPIKRLLGACFNPKNPHQPKGCIEFEYNGETYWRDAWDNLYSPNHIEKVGRYYPKSKWASIGFL